MEENKDILLEHLFAHLEGIVAIPILTLLDQKISNFSITIENKSLNELCSSIDASEGYLHVAIHTLSSLGIIKKNMCEKEVAFEVSNYGRKYLEKSKKLLFYRKINLELNNIVTSNYSDSSIEEYHSKINPILSEIKNEQKSLFLSNDEVQKRIAYHIEGVLLAPLLIYNNYSILNKNLVSSNIEIIKSILSINPNYNDEFIEYFNKRSKSYGVTSSYQPIYSNLDKLIFRNSIENMLYKRDKENNEIHVNRKLNIWGSGGAHKTYFKKIDEMIIDIFNQPIESQPLGVADMGCGDGMFLIHLYDLIKNKTLRGEKIKKHPLHLIGADLNKEALESAKKNLDSREIICDFIISDISNPEKYKKDLNDKFNLDIKDLLHVRSFLDHNRIYKNVPIHPEATKISSLCAYAHKGERVSSNLIISNLIDHLSNWKKSIEKHGLILLELHGIPLKLANENKMKTPTTAYESTHGFSDQYIVEYEVFIKCAEIANMERVNKYTKLYPDDKLTTVSLNLFK